MTTSATGGLADVPAGQVREINTKEARPDPGACPLGLSHRVGDAGCKAFRRAVRAKGLNAPRGGWACQPGPAAVLAAGLLAGRG